MSDVIAPGAENVGQSAIVTEFAKPFVLDGLFDSGAFKSTSVEDAAMMDGDGDVFYDAVEAEDTGMQGSVRASYLALASLMVSIYI